MCRQIYPLTNNKMYFYRLRVYWDFELKINYWYYLANVVNMTPDTLIDMSM